MPQHPHGKRLVASGKCFKWINVWINSLALKYDYHLYSVFILNSISWISLSGEDDEEEIEHAIEVLLRKYLVSKNDIAKRDYIRLL